MRVMVSDGGSRGFLLVCFNSAVKYLAFAITMSVAVAIVVVSLYGNQERVCSIQTELVEGIQV